MQNITRGYCPYVTGATGNTALDSLSMDVFPGEIRALFDRAFTYTPATAVRPETVDRRPSAREWREALGRFYRTPFVRCSKNGWHEYPKSYKKGCPWCAIEARRASPDRQASSTAKSGIAELMEKTAATSSSTPSPQKAKPKHGGGWFIFFVIVGMILYAMFRR